MNKAYEGAEKDDAAWRDTNSTIKANESGQMRMHKLRQLMTSVTLRMNRKAAHVDKSRMMECVEILNGKVSRRVILAKTGLISVAESRTAVYIARLRQYLSFTIQKLGAAALKYF